MRLAERSAKDREVLAVDADPSIIDRSEAGDDAVGIGVGVIESDA